MGIRIFQRKIASLTRKWVVVLNLFSAPFLFSQSQDVQLWTKFSLQKKWNEKWKMEQEFQYRMEWPQNMTLFSLRPWVQWKSSKRNQLNISPIAYFQHYSKRGEVYNEWRISLWDEWNFQYQNVQWMNRIGMEARIWEGNTWRIRLRTGVKWKPENKNWNLTFLDEVLVGMANKKEVTLQNRISGQWDVQVLPNHKWQVGMQCIGYKKDFCNKMVFYTGFEISI